MAAEFVTLRVVTVTSPFYQQNPNLKVYWAITGRYLYVPQIPPENASPQSERIQKDIIAALIALQGYNGPKNCQWRTRLSRALSEINTKSDSDGPEAEVSALTAFGKLEHTYHLEERKIQS